MEKTYNQAPLPFVGQKRMFVNEFRKVLKDLNGKTTFIDLFGGSGLLSHVAKRTRPDARVIYNDHDNYRERLRNIDRTNSLLADLRGLAGTFPRHGMVTGKLRECFIERIKADETTGFVGLHYPVILPAFFREICTEHAGAGEAEPLQQDKKD